MRRLKILQTFREQQRKTGHGPYHFQRRTETQSDTVANGGYSAPAKPVGMIFSSFRPSDDATVFPLFVPANFFAMVSLRQAARDAGTDPSRHGFRRPMPRDGERSGTRAEGMRHRQPSEIRAHLRV